MRVYTIDTEREIGPTSKMFENHCTTRHPVYLNMSHVKNGKIRIRLKLEPINLFNFPSIQFLRNSFQGQINTSQTLRQLVREYL